MIQQKAIPRSELDEILMVFKHYRFLILSLTLAIFVLSIFYAFFINKPIYTASAVIQIGQTNTRLVEVGNTLIEKLISKHEIYTNPERILPKISKVHQQKNSKDTIVLTALAHNKNELSNYLSKEILQIKEEHDLLVSDYKKMQKEILSIEERMLEDQSLYRWKLKNGIKDNEDQLDSLRKNSLSLSLQNTLLIRIIQEDAMLLRTHKEYIKRTKYITNVKKSLGENRTFNTHMMNKINVDINPLTPSKSIILTVGLVSGLILSILISFFLEFIANRKEEK